MAQIDTATARTLVLRERCRRSLSYFVQHCWPIIEPGVVLKWNWHLDVLCTHLEATLERRIRRLIISMPPRSLKSTIVSVFFPAWVWLKSPHERFLTASYAAKLAIRDSVRSRRVMQSEVYQALAPGFEFVSDQNEKTRYENNRAGVRVITTPSAATTGEGGNFLILDDPHNVRDVESEDLRVGTVTWSKEAWPSRMNEPNRDVQIIMAQRTHEDDVTGTMLKEAPERWDHVCLPTEYEAAQQAKPTSLGFVDPRTREGELLSPAHFGPSAVAEAREVMGQWAFNAQHQQRPSAVKGTIFDVECFGSYETLPLRFDLEFMSWDFAFQGKNDSAERARIADPSYVVGQYWGAVKDRLYLVDQVRGQWDFARSLSQFESFCDRHPHVFKKLIEKKANGSAIQSSVQGRISGIEMIEPIGSKVQRALAVQPLQQSGRIWLPARAAWLKGFLSEAAQFPFTKHDDQVDAMTQSLNFWQMKSGRARARLLKLVAR